MDRVNGISTNRNQKSHPSRLEFQRQKQPSPLHEYRNHEEKKKIASHPTKGTKFDAKF